MGHHDSQSSIAGLVISEEVLAAIAVTAARDVDGVSALVPRTGALRLIPQGGKEANQRYVKISVFESELMLELSLRIRASAKISSVAANVQRAVKNAVQNMTGKAVARVNLRILGADF